MLDTLITNARIITMDDASPVFDSGCIGIADGKISFVSLCEPENVQAREIIDACGNIVTVSYTHLTLPTKA